ncbi:MAG: helix-turn-helix domain-containing protein [Candidatus Aminicenantes bacterium]|nr:helix-turn-helix domain-containing protein [Candidatus Aminicenantes bacterium]
MPLKKNKSRRACLFFPLFFFSFILVSNSLFSLDPKKELKEYFLRNWTVQSGLTLNTVTALVQTQDGYIWVGTGAGLSRFDGVRFKSFTKQNSPLSNDSITTLYEDANDVLWIGTDGGGLYSYEKGLWKNFTMKDGLSNAHVRTIIGDWKGDLWVGTDYGLNLISQNSFHVYTEEDGLYDSIITDLCIDSWGTLWIGTMRGGLARFNEGIIAVYGYEEGLLNSSVQSLTADRAGNIWIGTLEGLYLLRSGDGIIRSVFGTRYTPLTSLLEDNQGNLWMATMADGLKRMIGGILTGLSTDEGLPDDFIRCLLVDRDENIWIGTDIGGLVQLRDPAVTNITRENGIPERAVSAVMEDRQGFLWVGTRNSGLCKMKNGRVVETFDAKTGLSSKRVRALLEDSSGNIWVGTEDGGLTILQNGRWNKLNSDRGLSSNNVTCFLQDRKGIIWIGTDKGLDRFRDGKIEPAGGLAGLAGYHVRVLLETCYGLLLVGTNQGLFKISEMEVEKIEFTRADSEPEIVSLYEDAEGILWIGTKGEGLLRRDEAETMAFTTGEGLTDNYIYSLTEDGHGNLWMSTNRGVMRISLKVMNDYIQGKIRYLAPALFDEAGGIAGSQCSGEGQPLVWKNGDGRLYYPTAKGIVVFDTAKIGVKTVPPLTLIEAVLCDGNPAETYGAPCFPYRSGSLEFHFTALDFRAPEKIRFKYRLEGHDEEFVYLPLTAERVARYVNLAPGEYRFTVKAASNDGIWDENGAFFVFEILPSFFQKPVFYVLVVLALLSVAGSVLLVSHQRRQRRRRDKYKTIPIDPKRIEDVITKLLHLMDEEKLFLDPDLTLNKLSLKLRVHYNHLSRIINERFGLSYSDFVNKYRIEEARKKLTSSEEKESTMLDIAYSTGFYSKSVFNAAFKKFLGMTPTEYRKKHL